jgi:hypothetical protein
MVYLEMLPVVIVLGWPWLLFAWAAGAAAGFVSGCVFFRPADDKPRTAGCSITEGDRRANVKYTVWQRPMPAGPPPGLIPSEEASE